MSGIPPSRRWLKIWRATNKVFPSKLCREQKAISLEDLLNATCR